MALETSDIEYWWPHYPTVGAKNFNNEIWHKREFNELGRMGNKRMVADYLVSPDSKQKVNNARGLQTRLFPYQIAPQRYMSPYTPFNSQLIFYETGTGKSATVIGIVENIQSVYFKRALIIVPNTDVIKVWIDEIVKFNPDKYESDKTSSEKARDRERRNKIDRYYEIVTRESFASVVSKLSDVEVKRNYSDRIIVIDEAHHLRIKSKKKGREGTLSLYEKYRKFIQLLDNIKLMLLTATPMIDSEREIVRLANLILPPEDAISRRERNLPLADFLKVIRRKLRGLVSFVARSLTTIPKQIIGSSNYGDLEKTKIYADIPPDNSPQLKAYGEALKKDKREERDAQSIKIADIFHEGLRHNSLEASNLVFPPGEWGNKGFDISTEDVIVIERGKRVSRRVFKDNVERELKAHLPNWTAKYNSFLTLISTPRSPNQQKDWKLTKGQVKSVKTEYGKIVNVQMWEPVWSKSWGFSASVEGSGLRSLALILEMFGWIKVTPSNISSIFNQPKRRFILASGSTTGIRKLRDAYNDPRNYGGHYIQVFLGSKALAEGFSLRDTTQAHNLAPYWNPSLLIQALGRIWRSDSHEYSLQLGLNPTILVYNHAFVPPPSSELSSVDLELYRKAESKDIGIRSVMRVLKEIAWDCPINYKHNTQGLDRKEMKGTAICDYTECDYKCDGITYTVNPKTGEFVYELPDSKINNTTFRLYNYSGDIVNHLKLWISWIFNTTSQIKLKTLISRLKIYTPSTSEGGMWWGVPEVIRAVENLIRNRTVTVNRWGVLQRIEQRNDLLFLVDNKGSWSEEEVSVCILQDFWSVNFIIEVSLPFAPTVSRYLASHDRKKLRDKCDDASQLTQTMGDLSLIAQQVLLEQALLLDMASSQEYPTISVYSVNKDKVKAVKDFFKRNYHLVKDPITSRSSYVHSLLIDNRRSTEYGYLGTTEATGLLRILDISDPENLVWRNPVSAAEETEYNTNIKASRRSSLYDLAEKYGYSGDVERSGAFRVFDRTAEDNKRILVEAKGGKLTGVSHSKGRVCTTQDKAFLLRVLWILDSPYVYDPETKRIVKYTTISNWKDIQNMTKKEVIMELKANDTIIDPDNPKVKKEYMFDWKTSKDVQKLRKLVIWARRGSPKTQLCEIVIKSMRELGILNETGSS